MGSERINAACKLLVKLTPVVNFQNYTNSLVRAFKSTGVKAAFKMKMTLTPDGTMMGRQLTKSVRLEGAQQFGTFV